MTESSRKK